MPNDNILHPPRPLSRKDKTDSFNCGVDSLDTWFQRFALINHRSNNAVVYVSTLNNEVVGYYAISTGAIARNEVDPSFGDHRPNPIPIIILARLAVAQKVQGYGVGKALFKDALTRMLSASEIVGAAALIIHAHDEEAKEFYLKHADFHELPGNPLHLLLPTKAIRKLRK